mgnify:CR=1 FL=1
MAQGGFPPPINATLLGWDQSTPFSGASIDSNWTESVSGDLASQRLQYYADGTCSIADGTAITIASDFSIKALIRSILVETFEPPTIAIIGFSGF